MHGALLVDKKGMYAMEKEIYSTRRNFIKTAISAAAICSAGGLMACSANPSNDKVSTIEEIQWDEEYDIVIVGAGNAGAAAALTVATEGSENSCILLEKGSTPIGNSGSVNGSIAITDDADKFFTYLKALYADEGTVSDEVLRAFAEGTAENYDWVMSFNPIVEEMSIDLPGKQAVTQPMCYPEYPELDGSLSVGRIRIGRASDVEVKGPKSTNAFLMQCVTEDYAERITYSTKSPLTGLVQDPDTKAVLGAIVDKNGKTVYIKANKGVIMTCGGFEANPKMLQDFFGQPNALGEANPIGNTGDGHKICQKLGADFWHMNAGACFWMQTRNNDDTEKASTKQRYGITVGTHGRRFFMDHGGSVDGSTFEVGSDIRVNVNVRHGQVNHGGEYMHIPMPSRGWFICDSNGKEAGAYGSTEDPVAEQIAYSADTIEELAVMIDVPADELARTVAVWNGYCETGEDLSFYRPASYMEHASITTPPFYATLCRPGLLNTDGGPVRNEKAQILDTDGQPIPNLYSAGEFGSIWSRMYQGACNVGECLVFGRIAVRTALGLL